MSNTDYQAAKVGVTTTASRTDRLDRHTQEGWQLIQTWDVATGADAEDIETSILRWWRDDLEAPEAMTPDDMPQGGYTETAPLVLVDLDETVARIQAEVDRLAAARPL